MSGAFDAFGLPAALLSALEPDGITEPTPVQRAAVPPLLAGRDLRATAPTGTGKTLAYGLPLLAGIDTARRAPQALVLCPTRELVAQVTQTLRRAGRGLPGLRVLDVAGGAPGWRQRAALEQGVHVVVATPGRCLDHLTRGSMDPTGLRLLVLDEADRMLDMGFSEQVGRIVLGLPRAQRAFFSATWPEALAALADDALDDPVRVTVAGAPPQLRHAALPVGPEGRDATVQRLLREAPRATTIVFVREKAEADALASRLRAADLDAAPIHGDLEQRDRDRVLAMLRNGSVRILVATDLAARGLDVHGLDRVVNVGLPPSREAYVHRAGRTGRAGAAGIVVSVVSEREAERLSGWVAELDAVLSPHAVSPVETPAAPESPTSWTTLLIHGGRRHKLRPGDVLGALTGPTDGGGAALEGADVGTIEIRDDVTYVAVRADAATRARRALAEGRVKGRRMRVDLA